MFSPGMEGTPQLSTRTLRWLASRPPAREVVDSVWDTLFECNDIDHLPRLRAALRSVLAQHEPTRAGHAEPADG
jgi:hypothetical protein